MTFDADIYEVIREGTKRSAAAVVPILHDLISPERVIDVGGGEGWWAREFAVWGRCHVLMLDESVEEQRDEIIGRYSGVRFDHIDLENDPLGTLNLAETAGRFDLAISLEVAEHLSPPAGQRLITSLCALAPVVVFSAAIPGQGGHGHLNEQWPDYWARQFEDCGFKVSGALRWRLWGDVRVEPWYQQNLLVAIDRDRTPPDVLNYAGNELFGEHAFDDPIRVVHPAFYESRCGELRELRGGQ